MNTMIRGGNAYALVDDVLFVGPVLLNGAPAPFDEWGAVAFDSISHAERIECEAIELALRLAPGDDDTPDPPLDIRYGKRRLPSRTPA